MNIKKVVLGCVIFVTTLLVFGLSVDQMWYREDDLGQIINGIMRTKEDVIRVFTADEREFIVPVNFKRSKANVLSGFLRPIKNIFFTGIYAVWGLNVKAFYWQHVVIHALNAVLFFFLLSLFMSCWFAVLGGLLFAFFPDNSWLVWIAATHNSLSTMFLLLSFIFYRRYFLESSRLYYLLAGVMFFLSLLSRENAVFFPFWMFAGLWLYYVSNKNSWWQSMRNACAQSWIFFAANVLYVLWRLVAFGIQTLDRTFYNLALRFPYLSKFMCFQQLGPATNTVAAAPAPVVVEPVVQVVAHSFTWWHMIIQKSMVLLDRLFSWSSIMFCVSSHTMHEKIIIIAWWLIFGVFCWIAYRGCYALLLFFIIGFYCFSWQAFVAYPAARYINSAYPVIIAMVVFGLYFLYQEQKTKTSGIIFSIMLACTGYSLVTGVHNNAERLHSHAANMVSFEQRYAQFFNEHTFTPGTDFILLGSPFVSDIQNIFQYFMGDLNIKLAHELFATVAERGYFGCQGDYRSKGVPSRIEPIPGGFRFISLDPDHCAWWMHFSDHPMQWSAKDGAYRWMAEPYQEGVWYDCSIGKFCINKRFETMYIIDVSFVIDKKWLTPKTVVVSWDTMHGKYIVLDAGHLENL